jgi:tRNA threonylcarbamoyl adenosine modification protein YeaZ
MGLAAALPAMIEKLLNQAGRDLELVAVVVGPGSFTGLRAGLSVATGIGLGLGIKVVGVSVSEALAAGLAGLDGRVLWTAIGARRGRIFLDRGSGFAGVATEDIPRAGGRIAVCGNAAALVAGTLAARGTDVMLTSARAPQPVHVAEVAMARLGGALPPLEAAPLYVDAPEAKLPAGGLRAAPAAVGA